MKPAASSFLLYTKRESQVEKNIFNFTINIEQKKNKKNN